MLSTGAKVVFIGALGWATYALAFTALHNETKLPGFAIFLGALATTVSTIIQFTNAVGHWISGDKKRVRADITTLTQQKLVRMHENGQLGSGLTQCSVHVWEVPVLCRRVFSYAMRRAIAGILQPGVAQRLWKPKLTRTATFNLQQNPPSGIDFRKGKGIIGLVLDANDPNTFKIINYQDEALVAALDAGSATWDGKGSALTRNLNHDEMMRLSQRYREAAAIVIQDPQTAEPIGALTMSIHRGSDPAPSLQDNEPVLKELRALALLSGQILAGS